MTKIFGGCRREGLEDADYAFHAELCSFVAGFENSLGDEKKAGAWFKGLDGGLVGDVGEEAEGNCGVPERVGAVAVSEDWRWASGVDVGEQTEGKIEAADEGWSEAGAAGGVIDGEVDLAGEAAESIHEIEAVDAEALLGFVTEDVLDLGGDGLGFVALAGDVGQEEDDVRADEDGIKEVATGADVMVAGVEFEARERRQNGGLWGA